MDFELPPDKHLGQRALEFLEGVPTPKSSLRLQYEAETKVFRAQHGGLEDIRRKLGFSRRKMCLLLLVDPSAWTRWVRDESRVPPHIYRSLEWFLALNEKSLTHPDLATVFSARYKVPGGALTGTSDWGDQMAKVQHELKRQRLVSFCLMAALAVLGLLFGLR